MPMPKPFLTALWSSLFCAVIVPASASSQPLPREEASGRGRFTCVARAEVQPPPETVVVEKVASDELAPAPARVCPEGQLPQPMERYAPKGHPGRSPQSPDGMQLASVSYLYNSGYQYQQAVGMFGSATQHKPYLAPGDYHSLFEVAAESGDGSQIVEVGWTVDVGVNGDSNPHLFVFHWINGTPQCYNGCGWVQYSATRFPGMTLAVTNTPQRYGIQYFQGNWWVSYQDEWIGYFPGSRWGGTFTQLGLGQWFGEVSASSASPYTDMGNGVFGTSGSSARVESYQFILPDSSVRTAVLGSYISNPSLYNMGTVSLMSFNYGGPGL